MSPPAARPVTMLIGALGGEGGGVLARWIVGAAESAGLRAQMTSVPGVAQRTGATTYYIELFADGQGDEVLALLPVPGDVDLVVASELLEAGRAMLAGVVTPDRTTLVASSHRVYAIAEKGAMGDGRFDGGQVVAAAGDMARRAVIFDMDRLAREAGSVINAVLLGAVAATDILPLSRAGLEQAIRAGGIEVERNLAGFDAGYAAAREGQAPAVESAPVAGADAVLPVALEARIRDGFPTVLHGLLGAGAARQVDFQDNRHARLYLDRLLPVLERDRAAVGEATGFALTAEVARHLALRMAYEDVIRVADLKTRPERLARIRRETGARPGETVAVWEYLRPGLDEWCDLLPSPAARLLRRLAGTRRGPRPARGGLRVCTTAPVGFLMLRLMACLRPWRRLTSRWQRERAETVAWLEGIVEAAAGDPALAFEIAAMARLIKGYGDTHQRGMRSFRRISTVLPDLAGRPDAAGRLRALVAAALADPDGGALDLAIVGAGRAAGKA